MAENEQAAPAPVDRRALEYAVHLFLYPWDAARVALWAANDADARRPLLSRDLT